MKIIVYLRVSTARQGRSGLGLEAQRDATDAFARMRGAHVMQTYTEIESGKHSDRPELTKALHLARVTGSTLLIAKLDRLSRNAAFLLALRDSGVRFIAADMPDANELTVGVMSLVAQQEREAISKRTKEALSVARARGTRLGNPNGADALKRAGKGNDAAIKAIRRGADRHAQRLSSTIDELEALGSTSLGALADGLNAKGILTPRGGRWHKSSVRNLLDRLESLRVA